MRWDFALRRTLCGYYRSALALAWIIGIVWALAANYDMASFVLSVVVP
jgi:hypothetical protein